MITVHGPGHTGIYKPLLYGDARDKVEDTLPVSIICMRRLVQDHIADKWPDRLYSTRIVKESNLLYLIFSINNG